MISYPSAMDSKRKRLIQLSRYLNQQRKSATPLKHAYRYVHTFFNTSTIHGFRHISAIGRHNCEYAIWTLCLILGLAGTIYLSVKSWNRFQNYPTVNSIDRNYRSWNTSLPPILLCPASKISQEKLNNLLNSLPEEKRITARTTLMDLANLDYTTMNDLHDVESEIDPEQYMELLNEIRFDLKFQSVHNYDPVVSEMGVCYLFNSAISTHLRPEQFFKIQQVRPNVTTDIAQGSALDENIILVVGNINSAYTAQYSSSNDIPTISSRKFYGPINTIRNIEFEALSITCSPNLRTLNLYQRRCRFPNESNLKISEFYSYNLCRMDCRRRLAAEKCQCSPHFYPKSSDAKTCDIHGLRCLSNYAEMLTKLVQPETGERINCGCLPNCEDEHYYVENNVLSSSWFRTTSLSWSLLSYPTMRIKREVIFGVTELSVAVGGAAGLFLGCSVLSFIEIIYFFTLRLIFFVLKKRNMTKHGIPYASDNALT